MVEFGQVFADNERILPIECGKRGEGAGLKRIRRLIASKYEAIMGIWIMKEGLGRYQQPKREGRVERKRKPRQSATLSRLGELIVSN